MAVKNREELNKLILEIDNGDLTNLNEVMKKYSFKDYQSLMRYCVSILLVNENKYVSITLNGIKTDIVPSPDFIKENKNAG